MQKQWKIGVVFDTSKDYRKGHGTERSFAGLPNVEVALVDSNTVDLEPRMNNAGAKRHYVDYREMISAERPDIVCFCSRVPEEHYEPIKTAIESGCHILCEKPLCASLEENDHLITLAEQHNAKVAVAHLARYALVFRTAKRMIENGDIGKVLTVYGRGKEDERGGGEDMMVLGTHIFDLMTFLFGCPEYVFADVRNQGRPLVATDRLDTSEPVGICAGDAIWAYFRFANDVNGAFESRRDLYEEQIRMGITVVGTTGTLSVRYDHKRDLRLSRSKLPMEDEAHYEVIPLKEDRILPPDIEPIDYENYGHGTGNYYFGDNNRFAALDLMSAIDEDRQPVSSIYDAKVALEMIYGVYASSLARKAVTFPLEDRKHPLGE
ncbi:MAG: Gfo/Idh/MocA family oxidoreductase [Deltaproteobacteria bacterium]|nr:Gfo/Idh/MocA family oxidoreductase [Deltaproteobacteria bacterium]